MKMEGCNHGIEYIRLEAINQRRNSHSVCYPGGYWRLPIVVIRYLESFKIRCQLLRMSIIRLIFDSSLER